MIKPIYLFMIVVAVAIIAGLIGFDLLYVVGLILVISVANMGVYAYTASKSRNLKAIERIISNNKRNPMFRYLIAMRELDYTEVVAQLEKIIQKYKQPLYANTYAALQHVYLNDLPRAREFANQIPRQDMRDYNLALIDTMEGKGEAHLNTDFGFTWMNEDIRANYYFFKGDQKNYEKHRKLVLDASTGIQLALNTYNYQFMEANYVKGKGYQAVKKSSTVKSVHA